jgi:hypothetical protein
MIGFDRPLKPLWIYKFIQAIKIGDKIAAYNDEFNAILWELDGKEGKRKIRTVLSRYFLKSEKNSRSNIIEYTPMIGICKRYPLKEIKPLLLYYLLMRSQVLRTLTKMIYELYGTKEDINYLFLRKKIVERYGDRDISARSLRNFLSTLEAFDVLKINNGNNFSWHTSLNVNEMTACYMLKLYSDEYKKSPVINLEETEEYLFMYFKMPDINKIIRKYNGKLWEYSIRVNQKIILFDANFDWSDNKIHQIFYENKDPK